MEEHEARVKARDLSPRAADDVSARNKQHVPTFTVHRKCCSRIVCAKYGLFVISFLVWLAGSALMGVGTWSRLQRTSLAAFDHVTVDVAYLLIGIGAVMFVVSLVGCMGALRNNFIFAVVLVFVAQLVAGVLAFVLLDAVEGKMMNFLKYSCCGGASYQDWDASAVYNCSSTTSPSSCGVPSSCCLEPSPECGLKTRSYTETFAEQYVFTRGCIGALMSVFKDNLVIIGVITFVVGFLLICSLLLANCLLRFIVKDAKLSL
ncbi:hypothetical protein BaRGS_00022130 [Batillaria attramentaria]|uniref:Tetraspanin n=1 Tax=Batillaria attramentaria TaxID=370345 RepID=A0ABD0KHZ5_9CAEN